MQFLSSSEQLTRISQCLLSSMRVLYVSVDNVKEVLLSSEQYSFHFKHEIRYAVMKILIFQTFVLLLNSKTSSAKCLLKPGFGLSEDILSIPVDPQPSGPGDLESCMRICDEVMVNKVYFWLQAECSYFVLKSDSCTLFRHAVLVKITENNQTNAGICPKSDPNYELIKRYYYSASPDNITTHTYTRYSIFLVFR